MRFNYWGECESVTSYLVYPMHFEVFMGNSISTPKAAKSRLIGNPSIPDIWKQWYRLIGNPSIPDIWKSRYRLIGDPSIPDIWKSRYRLIGDPSIPDIWKSRYRLIGDPSIPDIWKSRYRLIGDPSIPDIWKQWYRTFTALNKGSRSEKYNLGNINNFATSINFYFSPIVLPTQFSPPTSQIQYMINYPLHNFRTNHLVHLD